MLVRGSTDRLRLDWSSDRLAEGPDGSRYMIQTERPLHEGTLHYPLVKRPDRYVYEALLASTDCRYAHDNDQSVRLAKKLCEWDAWDRAGRPAK